MDISPLSTESTPQSPPTPQCVPQGEGGEGGQVLFRLVAPGGGKEFKEEKERDPGKTLRTPPSEVETHTYGLPGKEVHTLPVAISKNTNHTSHTTFSSKA